MHTNKNLGFFAATMAMLAAFAASAAPIPLYDLYRRTVGLTYGDLSLTAVVYFIGAVTALLVFGRISNHLGRKPVVFITFALAAVSSVVLMFVDGAGSLIFGRLLLGLACGLASSATASFVVDSAPAGRPWLPAAVVSNSPMVGLTLGGLVSGGLVEYGPYPQFLCYAVVLAALAVCAVFVARSEETVPRSPGLVASLRPSFVLPEAKRRYYPVAAFTFVATWALGGFYQSYGPSIIASQLHTQSTLTAAVVLAAYLLPPAIGGPLTARFSPASAQRMGMVIFTLAVAGLLVALKLSLIGWFLAATAVAGCAQGAVVTGSIRSLLGGVSARDRAGVLSLIYATSYTGAAIPSFIAGRLSQFMPLFQIAVCYGVLAVLACAFTLAFARGGEGGEAASAA